MDAGSGKSPCRKCGYLLDPQASLCGNCGNVVRSGFAGPSPGSSVPGGLIKTLVRLAVIAGIVFAVRAPISQAIRDARDSFDPPAQPVPTFAGPSFEVPVIEGPSEDRDERSDVKGYPSVERLVRDLNRGGLNCSQTVVDGKNDTVTTGSCQAGGVHVQINVYFWQPSIEAVKKSLRSQRAFSHVHKDNWFVISQAHVVKQVRKILGGKAYLVR